VGGFDYSNIIFTRAENGNELVIKGEIKNCTGKDYNAVATRCIIFSKSIIMASVVIVVNGLSRGRTKTFEKHLEELQYNKVFGQITRYEVFTESVY